MKKNAQTEKKLITKIESISELTPHNEALYDAGKKLLTESIIVGREFCKSMISINTGAIPIYLGILAFLLPDGYLLGIQRGILIITPALLYLLATIIFALGYLPRTSEFSLDVIDEIARELQIAISRLKRFIYIGIFCFVAATLMAIVVIILNLGAK